MREDITIKVCLIVIASCMVINMINMFYLQNKANKILIDRLLESL